MRGRIAAVVVSVFLAYPVLACQLDTDCFPGSRCVKPGYSAYGFCQGGTFPGNRNDRAPSRDVLDPYGTAGKTCMSDAECGGVNQCSKEYSSVYGVCQRRRIGR